MAPYGAALRPSGPGKKALPRARAPSRPVANENFRAAENSQVCNREVETVMNEKIHPICAGSRSVFEVVKNADVIKTLTIRETQHPERCITIMRSMVPSLINILRQIN